MGNSLSRLPFILAEWLVFGPCWILPPILYLPDRSGPKVRVLLHSHARALRVYVHRLPLAVFKGSFLGFLRCSPLIAAI